MTYSNKEEPKENPARPEGAAGERMLDRMNASHEPIRAFAFPLLSWRENMRILEVGCGGGAAIAEMLKLSPGSIIDGIDYSEVSVQKSSLLNRDYLGSRCFVQQADVSALPFETDTFDLTTAVETVYFWPDIRAGLREIFRVLKPSGTFAILNEGSDPDHNDWPKIDGFMRIYRPEELEQLLRECGFQNIRTQHGPEQIICVTGCKPEL